MNPLDPRTTAARGDIAASSLRGKVDAQRFVDGVAHHVRIGVASLRVEPSNDAMQDTELLFGEDFVVFDEKNGWAWGQAKLDSYVGYVRSEALANGAADADHVVSALLAPVRPQPDLKIPPRDLLPMNAPVKEEGREKRFLRIGSGQFVFVGHLRASATNESDWVEVALRFLGVPYVWGGRTARGLDCSGLIQTALHAAGIACPRDADMQEEALGKALSVTDNFSGLQRGDLVFWKDHVGAMLDESRILHANGFAMAVSIEPLTDVVKRNRDIGNAVSSVRRLFV
ncbi:MAG: C40 family peptidase [Proteobacteria bacterium]|nr:C40 family peptidase [Pseudomonadota bacterium]